jgi:hypothetical protein
MKYLKLFGQITETLKSDEIEIVVKKLDNFFQRLGYNKKIGWGGTAESPNYQIVSDRDYLKGSVEDYKDKKHYMTKGMVKAGYKQKDLIKSAEEKLAQYKYGDIFIFSDSNNPELSKNLMKLIDSIGYFIASVGGFEDKVTDKSKIQEYMMNSNKISISIEPNYDDLVSFSGKYLYHTTNVKALDKIMKIGLVPKTKNTRSFYPERIYLSPNIEYNKAIQDQLNSDKPGDYIDLKIKNFSGLKLYKDVRFKGGFYTYTNIAPKYIEIIKK